MRSIGGIYSAVILSALIWSSAPAAAEPEGTVTVATHISIVPAWFDPAKHTGSQSPGFVYYAIHDALLKPMPEGSFTNSLAESLERSSDGLVYEFKLREGLTFHNGEPLTSEDAKFSFDRYTGAAADVMKSRLASVETPDPLTIRYTLKEPWPDFLYYFATPSSGAAWVLPKDYMEEVGEDGFLQNPIGAGPYRFSSFTPGVELVVEAWKDYWRKEPNIERFVVKSIPDMTTRAAMLKQGEADIVTFVRGPIATDLQATEGIRLQAPRIFFTQFLIFAEQWKEDSPWSNIKVRQAVNHAIDREGIGEAEFLGLARPGGQVVPAGLDFAKEIPAPEYDPEKARALLAEAGYPDGFDGGEFFLDAAYSSIAEVIQGNLQAVGINLRMRALDRAAYYDGLNQKTFTGVVYAIYSGFDNAGTFLEQWVMPTGRSTFGTHDDVTALMEKQAVELDEEKRQELLDEVQQLIADRVMFTPIIYAVSSSAVGPRLERSGLDEVIGFPYIAPFEDVTLHSK